MDIVSKYSKGKIIHASQYHSVCGHSSSLRVCTEQQQSCFSVYFQRVKHVVLRSSREHTTEQIIMIQNSVSFWTRAISPPSVYCPQTGRNWPVCVQDASLHVYFTCLFYIWCAILSALCSHTLQHYQHLFKRKFSILWHVTHTKIRGKSQCEPNIICIAEYETVRNFSKVSFVRVLKMTLVILQYCLLPV